MSNPKKGSAPYILRGLAYSTTSILVLVSGYSMNNKVIQPLTLLLSIPIVLFMIFFVVYAVCYDYDYGEQGIEDEWARAAHKDAIRFTSIIAGLLLVIALLVYFFIFKAPVPSKRFLVYVLFNCFLYFSYSAYLYKKWRLAEFPRIRHWLIWPVILSVAISLYYGRYFSVAGSSLKPHFSVLILLTFFMIAELIRFKQKEFLIGSFVILGVLVLLTILKGLFGINLPEVLGIYFPGMLFAIIMSAYLAVFESWRMTAYIADKEKNLNRKKLEAHDSEISSFEDAPLTLRYYSATLLAHTIAVWFIPLAYIFSDYGVVFIAGFTVHAIASFSFWLIKGKDPKSLSDKDWAWPKIIFGVFFLIIMVSGVRFKPNIAFDTSLLGSMLGKLWIPMGAVSAVFLTLIVKAYKEIEHPKFMERVIEMFSRKTNVVRLIAISTFAAYWILWLIEDLPRMKQYFDKLQQAYIAYFLIFLCCLLVEGLNIGKLYTLRPVLLNLVGVAYTMRIPPSFLIVLIITLPGLFAGAGLLESLLPALPFGLVAMGGFALNDFLDVEKDKINKPYRAVPAKMLSPSQLLAISGFFLASSAVVAWFVMNSTGALSIYLVAFAGVVAYNLVVRYFGWAKAFYTALVSALPLLYDVLVYGYSSVYFLGIASVIMFVSARELLMDIRDMPGDRAGRMITLPMMIGGNATVRIAFGLMGGSLALLVPFMMSTYLPKSVAVLTWMLMVGSLGVMYRVWRSDRHRLRVIRSLWATMLLGIIIVGGSHHP